ncbi:ABC transporter G member 22, partial [Podila horticola]
MPGRVLAIMGPSGSGKTTLLDLLANRQARNIGKFHGEILLNGLPIDQFGPVRKRLVGYVTQESDFIETLTVLETLTFAAKMRLPRSMNIQEKVERVYEVMQELNLTHIKDTKVGGPTIRGISGGEKRRITIGIELLSSPSVLLLDEPTTGLSSTDALNVTNAIKDLSSKGRTVILAVHQPRSDIYEGKLSTSGELNRQLPILTASVMNALSAGMWQIIFDNPTKEKSSATLEDFVKSYSNYLSTDPRARLTQLLHERSKISENIEGEVLLSKFKKEYTTEYATTTLDQTLMASQRSLTNLARHPIIFQAAAAVQIVFALITIVETLSYTILTIIFVVITYYFIGLHGSLIYYFILLAVFVNVALSLIAAIGAGVENAEVGLTLLALVNTMAMLFSGFLVCRVDIPRGWIWAFWASYYQWAFSGMLINEFSNG